jgi:hypothetical protein
LAACLEHGLGTSLRDTEEDKEKSPDWGFFIKWITLTEKLLQELLG